MIKLLSFVSEENRFILSNRIFQFHLGGTNFPSHWSKGYLISCTVGLYFLIFLMLSYWHFSMCCILFNREALLRDNTVLTRYRRQVAQLLIVIIISFFILILPYKLWAVFENFLTFDELSQIGFHAHAFILVITRTLLYLNSAVSRSLFLSINLIYIILDNDER